MFNTIEDVSKLTTIPVKNLNHLVNVFIYCIVDAIREDNLKGEELTELDLGLGQLHIQHVGKQLKYKFIPSNSLNDKMRLLFEQKLNSLEDILEKNLVDKIVNTYKDLI